MAVFLGHMVQIVNRIASNNPLTDQFVGILFGISYETIMVDSAHAHGECQVGKIVDFRLLCPPRRALEYGSLLPLCLPAGLLAGKGRLYRGRNMANKLVPPSGKSGSKLPHSKALRARGIFPYRPSHDPPARGETSLESPVMLRYHSTLCYRALR